MPFNLEGFRVFIASPGGLEAERVGFRDAIDTYNKMEACPRGYIYEAIGWEDTLATIGRPQRIVNEDLVRCDFCVVVLHDRWGTDPGSNTRGATSGTHEEYLLAMECLASAEQPMQDVVVLFKGVSPNQMSDPGAQLKKVIAFRKKLEREKKILYGTFSSTEEFKTLIRGHLGRWLRQAESPPLGPISGGLDVPPSLAGPVTETPDEIEEEATLEEQAQMEKAWALADAGKLVEAEIAFSEAVIANSDIYQRLEYARFLRRIGRLDQAMAMIDAAITRANEAENKGDEAAALRHKGNVLYVRGDLDGAEAMYKKSLAINEQLGRLEGMASQYGNLGNVLRVRGDLDGAEAMHKKSLAINEQLGRLEGMASQYGNLGIVLRVRGDLDGAEAMYKKSLAINEQLGRLEGMASQYGNLGNVFRVRGDLNGAEAMYKKALAINEQLGRLEGIASDYGNLGNVLRVRGDLDGAEAMYKKGLEIATGAGFQRLIEHLERLLQSLTDARGI